MLIRLITNVSNDNWNTQLAAYILLSGITILLFKNHKPTVSANTRMMALNPIWIVTEEENTLFNFSLFPVPNSNVMKRDMAADSDPDNIENIATTPPTTLYIP